MPTTPLPASQPLTISLTTQGRLAVSEPTSTTTQLLPYMLSSIHSSMEALPFRLTSSHAFAVQRVCPSRAPMLRTCWVRSEEHTSELQSLMRISYAVFCLKKKNKANQQ